MCAIAIALLLVGAPDKEYDVLRLKNGREVKGFIVKETEKSIRFRIVILGSKGETSGGVTTVFRRSEISKIERASDKARERAKARSKAASTRPLDYENALRKYQPFEHKLMGKNALRLVTPNFVILSTCDERFVREVAFYLDDITRAYRKTFGIEARTHRKPTVYMLRDVKEYKRFQMEKLRASIENPAFYIPGPNAIYAYNLDPVDKANEIRAQVLKYERKAQEYKKEATRFEKQMRKDALEARREIDAEATRAKNAIRRDSMGNKAGRIAQVEAWRKRQNDIVTGQKRAAEKKLKAYRKEASDYISKNRRVLANNYRFRLARNKDMFECLFHEAFHAFSLNNLWKERRYAIPRWIEEGLATYYERSVIEADQLIHGSGHPYFLKLLKGEKPLPLEKVLKGHPTMFLIRHRNDVKRSNLYYAQSWATAHYMVGRVPQKRIVAYVNSVTKGANPVKAFETLMGKPVRDVEAEIAKHLRKLGRR